MARSPSRTTASGRTAAATLVTMTETGTPASAMARTSARVPTRTITPGGIGLPRKRGARGELRLDSPLAARSPAFRHALAVAAASRALVWLVAILSAKVLGARSEVNAHENDIPALTASAGAVGRVLLTPLARWDAVWYLGIVRHVYAPVPVYGQVRAAFFPLYPALVW